MVTMTGRRSRRGLLRVWVGGGWGLGEGGWLSEWLTLTPIGETGERGRGGERDGKMCLGRGWSDRCPEPLELCTDRIGQRRGLQSQNSTKVSHLSYHPTAKTGSTLATCIASRGIAQPDACENCKSTLHSITTACISPSPESITIHNSIKLTLTLTLKLPLPPHSPSPLTISPITLSSSLLNSLSSSSSTGSVKNPCPSASLALNLFPGSNSINPFRNPTACNSPAPSGSFCESRYVAHRMILSSANPPSPIVSMLVS